MTSFHSALGGLGPFIPPVKPRFITSWRLHAAWSRSELPARSGELFLAKVGDFVLAKGIGAWTLRLSKSGQRQGASDSLTISDKFVGMAVTNFCKKKSPGHNLSAVSPGLQRKRLNDLLGKLHVDAGYRWYSLRRGGATHEFQTICRRYASKDTGLQPGLPGSIYATAWHSCPS